MKPRKTRPANCSTPVPAVTELVKTRQRIAQLQADLKEAERDDLRALKDGWSEDELRRLGLENTAAAKRRTRRPATPAEPGSANT